MHLDKGFRGLKLDKAFRGFKLDQNLPPWELAFIVPEDTMKTTKEEKQPIVLPATMTMKHTSVTSMVSSP